MERQIIEFRVHGDRLERLTPRMVYASNTVHYIEARFHDLESDSSWTGYDDIHAVWYTDFKQTDSEIADETTVIPAEVLTRPGVLKMNLCANKSENGVLIARNTSYPVDVLELTRAKV